MNNVKQQNFCNLYFDIYWDVTYRSHIYKLTYVFKLKCRISFHTVIVLNKYSEIKCRYIIDDNKQYAPKQFSYENKIFFSKTFYTLYCTNLPFHILCWTYYPIHIQSKQRSMNFCQKLYNIVKFSQIFLSFHIRKCYGIFWFETKTFINKNGKWKIPDLDRQIWISVQQPGRLMRDEHTFALLLVLVRLYVY